MEREELNNLVVIAIDMNAAVVSLEGELAHVRDNPAQARVDVEWLNLESGATADGYIAL